MFSKHHLMLKFILTTLLVIGGLAWGILGMTGFNPISRFANLLRFPILTRIIYTMIGLASILYILKFFNKDTFLPFLGQSVFPSSLLNVGTQSQGNFDRELTLTAPPESQAKLLAFWAADEGADGKTTSAEEAYGDFHNSGVVPVVDGQATIRFKDPGEYHVMEGKKHLESHIHYRWIGKSMMGKVNTAYV